MKNWLSLSLCITLWLATPSLAANDPDRVQQRQAFIAAEKALLAGNLVKFEQLTRQLSDYPLLPYLEYAKLHRHLGSATPASIHTFIERYDETHLATRLHSRYLKQLAQKKDWLGYIDNYAFTENVSANCNYQLALYHTGYQNIALKTAKKIWLSAHSLPKTCDPLFKYWFDAGGPDADLAWQRFELAINARQLNLAKYLEQFLPDADKPLAEFWRQLRRNPLLVLQQKVPPTPKIYRDKVRLYAALQTARIAPDRLNEVWSRMVAPRNIDANLIQDTVNTIALTLAQKHKPAARSWYERLPADARDSQNNEWYLRSLLRAQDWQAISDAINHLPREQAQSQQWRYWQARALEHLDNKKESERLYAQVAQKRSYYGFLAADRIDQRYQFNVDILKHTQTDIDHVEELDAIKRIKELIALKRKTDANREWYYLLSHLDNEGLKKFASLLHQWGWHDRAILTMARSNHRDDIEIRFPLLHQTTVSNAAAKHQIEATLLLAMIRQESAYNVQARSPAGARGLMQLMPGTARNVAKSLKLPFQDINKLYEAEFNITLGSSYLAQMLKRFNNNSILATAAYNAGPHRVKRWLPKSKSLPADIWVDTIPFTETRGYVKNVHAYIAVYNYRLGQSPIVISQQMKPVGPETTAKNNPTENNITILAESN